VRSINWLPDEDWCADNCGLLHITLSMKQRALRNVNNCLYTNVYSYLETSGGISYNLYLNAVHFFQYQS
jgi:hypothetical protein